MDNIFILATSLLLSGFFSGMEIAFVTANRLRIELDLKKGKFTARLLNVFYHDPSKFIGAMLLGNYISMVIFGITLSGMLSPLLASLLPQPTSGILLLVSLTLIAALIFLLFAEFIPRLLFRFNPNAMVNIFGVPAWLFYFLFYPLNMLFMGVSNFILNKLLRLDLAHTDYKFSAIDLNEYLQDYTPDENNEEEVNADIQLFQNAIEFRHVKLRDCMVPRTEIEALKAGSGLDELLKKFTETKHSKILIYQDTIDNIIGYVHSFDMFKKPGDISEVLRTVHVYPETYAANTLLSKFIQTRQGIAVVVDEFGGTSGIVSMEDIIEEIFGEIDDEFDEEVTIEKDLGNGAYLFSARLEIDYLNEAYDLEIPESDDYETLAGFILHYHESIPRPEEEILIPPYRIRVTKATATRLDEVHFSISH